MPEVKTAPYGTWKSPITSELIVARTVGLGEVVLDGEDIYWIESRPSEGGRNAIVHRSPDGELVDVIRTPFNARTRVHEYGGGSFTVHEGVVYFSNFADQRLYRVESNPLLEGGMGIPHPITPETALRYADGVIDTERNRMLCVREDHRITMREPINTIVAVDLAGDIDGGEILVEGNDFYAAPRLSPDGKQLAWLTWNHPNMPWDGTELWVAEVQEEGALGEPQKVAGGDEIAIFQPAWSPDGVLYFISDVTGWWNIYRWHEGRIEQLVEMDAEFGRPLWVFGMSTYDFESADSMICTYTQDGIWYLARLDLRTEELTTFDLDYTHLQGPAVAPQGVIVRVGSPTESRAIARWHPESGEVEILRQASDLDIDRPYLSEPQSLEFPTEEGRTAHALFYPPQNPDFEAPEGELPPLLVFIHGGPTAAASSTLKLGVQYWTSRGFAVLDVNYGGSTGYGRAYRQRLQGEWGVVDVADCVNGARYLVEEGLVDPERLAIRGGSAGGYTTLCALTFHDVFSAGASYYGVADLEALAQETHKFESRYLDSLVGPYPEEKERYEARSPIRFTDRLSCPVIFFQGLEDEVVPPNQAERMVQALQEKGVPVAYQPFEGEQHGFRRAENVKRSLDAELYFYSRIFDFALPEPVEPVPIRNLDEG